MTRIITLLLVPIAFSASAQTDEDDAHRADRARTEALNRNAAAIVAKRNDTNAGSRDRYRAAVDRYQEQLREWRRRVDACRAGYWDACN